MIKKYKNNKVNFIYIYIYQRHVHFDFNILHRASFIYVEIVNI